MSHWIHDIRALWSTHRTSLLRSPPWVTLAVIALSFAVTWLAGSVGSSPRTLLREAARYWSEHPYLSAEPELSVELGRGRTREERTVHLEQLRESTATPDVDTLAEEQAELDRLTDQALEAPHGASTWGFTPTHPDLRALLLHSVAQRGLGLWLPAALVLLLLGATLEAAWSPRAVAVGLAIGGIGPAVLNVLLDPGSDLALRGAQALTATWLGLVIRELGAAGGLGVDPRALLGNGSPEDETGPVFVIPVWALGAVWLVYQIVELAVFGLAGYTHVAVLGGLLIGGLVAPALRPLAATRIEHVPSTEPAPEASQLLDQARKARARTEHGLALALLRQAVRERSDDAEIVTELWEAALACGRPDIALPRMTALVQRGIARGELSPAARHWLRIRQVDPNARLPRDAMIPLASTLVRLRENVAATSTLRAALDDDETRLSAALAIQAAETARELGDEELVGRAARAGLALPYLPEALQVRLRTLLGDQPEAVAETGVPEQPDESAVAPAIETSAGSSEGVDETDFPAVAGTVRGAVVASDPEPFLGEERGESPPLGLPSRLLELRAGVPDMLGEVGLSIRLVGGTTEVAYAAIQAVAAAGVRIPGASSPVLIIDLVLNWLAEPDEPLRVIRLRSDGFDARRLVGDALRAADAFRVFLDQLRLHTGAIWLPQGDGEVRPLRIYPGLAEYEQDVLGVREPAQAGARSERSERRG